MTHDVRGDSPSETGWTRFTCYGETCEGATCLHQPYMSREQWRAARATFLRAHETDERDVKGWPR